MQKTKKLLYSLYAAGVIAGASTLSGCTKRTVYVSPDGRPVYPSTSKLDSPSPDYNQLPWQILSGVLQGLSGL